MGLTANSQTTAKDWALMLISYSCSVDFTDTLTWAQWCRRVAHAATINDLKEMDKLEREMTKHEE